DHLGDHLRRLPRLRCLRRVDLALARQLVGGDLLLRDVRRTRRRDLHREVAYELLEVVGTRDEIGLAIHLDQHADLTTRVDVGADLTFGGRTPGLLGRRREAALAQVAHRAVEIAARLAQRRLAIHEARAGLLAQVFHLLSVHLAHAISPPIGSTAISASRCSPTSPSSSSAPWPRSRSSWSSRPS